MKFTRDQWYIAAGKRKSAFVEIARVLGKEHPITKMMGVRAWGRSNFEYGPSGHIQDVIREACAADGAFDVINIWARDNDQKAQRMILEIYPRGFA